MRIVYMGTPDFAVRPLTVLYEAGYTLPLVVTQPDKPRGRGQKDSFSPVKAYAAAKGLPLIQPAHLDEEAAIAQIRDARPDVIVVVAYGQMLPPALLGLPPLGCLNIHPSLLPSLRGAAPIQWALLNGDTETGVTIMQMDQGWDSGPVICQERFRIAGDLDYGRLNDILMESGADLLLKTLPMWADHRLQPTDQAADCCTYAPRLTRSHETIDWSRTMVEIHNQIRAFSPTPGASAVLNRMEIKILDAITLTTEEAAALPASFTLSPDAGAGARPVPGQIVGFARKQGPVVAAGEGYLLLTKVQPAGKKSMGAWDWLNGSRLIPGQRFQI